MQLQRKKRLQNKCQSYRIKERKVKVKAKEKGKVRKTDKGEVQSKRKLKEEST